jgi:hypothetical protein
MPTHQLLFRNVNVPQLSYLIRAPYPNEMCCEYVRFLAQELNLTLLDKSHDDTPSTQNVYSGTVHANIFYLDNAAVPLFTFASRLLLAKDIIWKSVVCYDEVNDIANLSLFQNASNRVVAPIHTCKYCGNTHQEDAYALPCCHSFCIGCLHSDIGCNEYGTSRCATCLAPVSNKVIKEIANILWLKSGGVY